MTTIDRQSVLIKLIRDDGFEFGNSLDVNVKISKDELISICRLYEPTETEYNFFVKNQEITQNLENSLIQSSVCLESVVEVLCRAKSVIPAESITRCTSSLPGHSAAIITLNFSPDSQKLASGSGDSTVRIWDSETETPLHKLEGHKDWILAIAWSYDCRTVVSGDKAGAICIWDAKDGKMKFPELRRHKKWVTFISWEPLHLYKGVQRFASSSKDGSIIIWDATHGTFLNQLSIHLECVSCVRWSGTGYLYSSSHDLTIAVWKPDSKAPIKQLKGHSHWVNFIALNSDYILKSTYCYNSENSQIEDHHVKEAIQKYKEFENSHKEVMVSCSDDFTMILWKSIHEKPESVRITGHRLPINHVVFSPNGKYFASASFDKSIKLWDGLTGKFIVSLLGHVHRVYQLAWAPNSRLLCSTSADSTLKMWDINSRKLIKSLDGHHDEIYTVDWSNNQQKVASGSKDGILKLWR